MSIQTDGYVIRYATCWHIAYDNNFYDGHNLQ
jgi:hypothetical protein